jgi:hypothetical protein
MKKVAKKSKVFADVIIEWSCGCENIARALPEVGDGLKPVQRRVVPGQIFWAVPVAWVDKSRVDREGFLKAGVPCPFCLFQNMPEWGLREGASYPGPRKAR